jgi:hypothetical protein
MARPGLEPGTPRFSGGHGALFATAKELESTHFTPVRSIGAMFALCGRLPSFRGMVRSSSPELVRVPADPVDISS